MTRFVAIANAKYETGRMRLLLTIIAFAALALLSGRAHAFDLEQSLKELHPQYQAGAELTLTQSKGKSLSQAIAEIRNRTGGKVVGAETKKRGKCDVHRIKVLKDGKVKVHTVNGQCR